MISNSKQPGLLAWVLAAGLITTVCCLTFSRAADKALGGFSFVLSPVSIVLAIAMAAGTGLLFGLYPANQAARLKPIEALRRE